MNWEAAGTIGEIVGSIAVVISLIYVSLQIRHANKQSEIDSLRHTWDGLNQLCDRLSESMETASIVNRERKPTMNVQGSLDVRAVIDSAARVDPTRTGLHRSSLEPRHAVHSLAEYR